MGMRNFNCFIDDENIKLAKTKGMNISHIFRTALEAELWLKDTSDEGLTKDELLAKQTLKISKLIEDLRTKEIEVVHLKTEMVRMKKDMEESKWH